MLVNQRIVTESKKRNKKNVLFSYLKVKKDLLSKLSKSMASKLIAYCCYFSVNTNKPSFSCFPTGFLYKQIDFLPFYLKL